MAIKIDVLYKGPSLDICFCLGEKEVGKHLIFNPCEMLLIELLKLHNTNFGQKYILALTMYKHHVHKSSKKPVIVVKSRIY